MNSTIYMKIEYSFDNNFFGIGPPAFMLRKIYYPQGIPVGVVRKLELERLAVLAQMIYDGHRLFTPA